MLRAMVAQRVNLKFAPELRFELDHSFAAHAAIDALLKSPRVARDLAHDDEARAIGERPCPREPPRGNEDLGRGQDAHHDSMGMRGAR